MKTESIAIYKRGEEVFYFKPNDLRDLYKDAISRSLAYVMCSYKRTLTMYYKFNNLYALLHMLNFDPKYLDDIFEFKRKIFAIANDEDDVVRASLQEAVKFVNCKYKDTLYFRFNSILGTDGGREVPYLEFKINDTSHADCLAYMDEFNPFNALIYVQRMSLLSYLKEGE